MGFLSFYHLSYPLSIQGLFLPFHSVFPHQSPFFYQFLLHFGNHRIKFFPKTAEEYKQRVKKGRRYAPRKAFTPQGKNRGRSWGRKTHAAGQEENGD
jgi:hypothetical protein